MRKIKKIPLVVLTIMVIITSCDKMFPGEIEDHNTLDGAISGLTGEQNLQFLQGDVAFNDDVFTVESGLGPLFVSTSCGSCHAGDGKGTPFTTLTRFGQSDTLSGNQYIHSGGPQLQHRAIPGFATEIIPLGATFSKLTPPANTGLGFVDAISDELILSLSDPNDLDGDGISGRVNWINPPDYAIFRPNTILNQGKVIGRFGKKAAAYGLLQQTATAYNQDMGISSSFEKYDTYSGLEVDPEVSNLTINNVVFYLKTLKAPVPRNQLSSEVLAGKKIFAKVGCTKCHIPELTTGISSITSLSNKKFEPYSDFLLHDMGIELNDHYTEGTALPEEWRTPPLWGLGLSEISQGGSYFLLHDGRAKSIEEAILLHGGEGTQSREAYKILNGEERSNLINFLKSL